MYICQQEKICEDSASFDLSSADIASAMRELSELSDKVLEWVKEEEMGASNLNDSQMAISKTLIVNPFNLSKTYPYSFISPKRTLLLRFYLSIENVTTLVYFSLR